MHYGHITTKKELHMRTLSMAMLAGLGLAVLAGCQQKFTLEFVNMTHEERSVELRFPDGPRMAVGTLHKFGDRLVKKVTVEKEDLPMNVEWSAGDVSGNVNLEKHGPSDIGVMVGEKKSGSGNHSSHSDIRNGDERNVHDEKERTEKHTRIIVE
jgi:hypothetical protein